MTSLSHLPIFPFSFVRYSTTQNLSFSYMESLIPIYYYKIDTFIFAMSVKMKLYAKGPCC
jgi:hypothetical protein